MDLVANHDRINLMKLIKLPGLIDAHVHLRDPGQTHKEDLTTGTTAAIAGGFTTVLDMPNNAEPITSIEKLEEKRKLASQKALCDIGFHYGSLGDNLETFDEASKLATGLKLYLNKTTGGYLLDAQHLKKIYDAWPQDKVVLLHAEEDVIDIAIESMELTKRPIHVCHMPSQEILTKIMKAKDKGLPITCGVCPHHLFLTAEDVDKLGPYGKMLPSLKTKRDQQFLWDHFDAIDIIESDHAPHTHEEKQAGAFGVPGLETTLPLLLQAEREGKLTLDDIIDKCHTRPAEIFSLATDPETYVEVEPVEYEVKNKDLHTKCGWSPFDGRTVFGKVKNVAIRGDLVLKDSEFVAEKEHRIQILP